MHTGHLSDDAGMGYQVLTVDGTSELVSGADAYRQEGPLTTFFRTDARRQVIDCWSVRLASFRTVDLVRVRLVDAYPPSAA